MAGTMRFRKTETCPSCRQPIVHECPEAASPAALDTGALRDWIVDHARDDADAAPALGMVFDLAEAAQGSDHPEIDGELLRGIIRHSRISYSAWHEIDAALRSIVGEYNARVARSQKSATDE